MKRTIFPMLLLVVLAAGIALTRAVATARVGFGAGLEIKLPIGGEKDKDKDKVNDKDAEKDADKQPTTCPCCGMTIDDKAAKGMCGGMACAPLSRHTPAVLLAMAEELKLTDEQKVELKRIAAEAAAKAAKVLTADQAKALADAPDAKMCLPGKCKMADKQAKCDDETPRVHPEPADEAVKLDLPPTPTPATPPADGPTE